MTKKQRHEKRRHHDHLWVVMVAMSFGSLTAGPWPLQPAPGEPTRFIPVFDTEEEALKWSDGKWSVLPVHALSLDVTPSTSHPFHP